MKKIFFTFLSTLIIICLLSSCQAPSNQNNNSNQENASSTDNEKNNNENNTSNETEGEVDKNTDIGSEYQNPYEGEKPGATPEEDDKTSEGDTPTEEPNDQQPTEENNPDEDTNDQQPSESDKPTEEPGNEQTPVYGTQAGDLFADVSLQALSGQVINTADYRGKIIILNIWATWCPPCKAELPDFSKVASEYSDDVVIIAAHLPTGSADAQSYVQINLPDSKIIFAYDYHYNAFFAAGGVESIPQTAIIDQDGIILYSGAGMLSYDILVSIIESNLENIEK